MHVLRSVFEINGAYENTCSLRIAMQEKLDIEKVCSVWWMLEMHHKVHTRSVIRGDGVMKASRARSEPDLS